MQRSVKIRRWLTGIGVTLCLLVGLLLPTSFASAQAVTVSVDAPATVDPGDYFTVDIDISHVIDFNAGLFDVVFDSTVLAIDDIDPGDDITDGQINGTVIPVSLTNQIAPGRVRILVDLPGLLGATGEGYLCQIRFHAIGAAGTSSDIDLENGSLSDKYGNAIPATWTGATVSIAAPPLPTVAFSAATYSVGEGNVSTTITVNLSAASTATVTVDYATSDGTATAGSDYTAASGTLTFSPGDTSKTFSVTILEDAVVEGDETVNLSLTSPTNATLGTPSTAVLTIVDNDAPPPAVGGTAYPINKLAVLAPWIALAAAIIAGATIFVRRRRAQG